MSKLNKDIRDLKSYTNKKKNRKTATARRKIKPNCRPSLYLWERVRITFLFSVFLGLMFVSTLQSNPLMTFNDALAYTITNTFELLILLGLEITRQLLIFLAERVASFYKFVLFLSSFLQKPFTRVSERGKQNISRVAFWIIILFIYGVVAAKFTKTSPITAIFDLPSRLIGALPLVAQLLFAFFFIIFQFVGLFWFLSRGGVDTYFPEDIKTRFDQVWGQDHVVKRLKENLLLLEDPESIEEKGGHVPSGILLWGPPGTGKTLMAEAIAGETGKPYVFVDPGAFTNMFMGVGILKVKSLFRKLRKLSLKYGGVIVFFDEADSLGNRGGSVSNNTVKNKISNLAKDQKCHSFNYFNPSTIDVIAGSNEKIMMGGMAGGGGAGTLQALLSELQGLKKPRGFMNRVVRRFLGMRPKLPPKYRILVMMATNMPDSLDPALLRPGRIDRIYRVGYPSKEGRIRTYQGYLEKVSHELNKEDIERLAISTPYATGAIIKDLVNEALIASIARGSEVISWKDIIHAKHLKDLGPSEGVTYTDREQHSVAIHEACHAVTAYRLRKHLAIDVATIEKGSDYLGMVSSIPFEEMFSSWSSYYSADIAVAIASLVGEKMFFDGDSTSGVSGDLDSATRVALYMESRWGMGETLASASVLGDASVPNISTKKSRFGAPQYADRVEKRLKEIYQKTEELLNNERDTILSVAHALEVNKTLTGMDVEAVITKVNGVMVDGSIYGNKEFIELLNKYHNEVLIAQKEHRNVSMELPRSLDLPIENFDNVNKKSNKEEDLWSKPEFD
jgi:cell division protease FtsH